MPEKRLILVIAAEQAYIRRTSPHDVFSAPNDILFSAVTDTYIPLVDMMYRLEDENVPFKLNLVMSPLLCELLEDPSVQNQYIANLEKRIEIGKKELERNESDPEVLALVKSTLETLKKKKDLFENRYQKRIVKQIRKFVAKGEVEIIPTAASYAYLPHYADMPESINAQIEAGLYSAVLGLRSTDTVTRRADLVWTMPPVKRDGPALPNSVRSSARNARMRFVRRHLSTSRIRQVFWTR